MQNPNILANYSRSHPLNELALHARQINWGSYVSPADASTRVLSWNLKNLHPPAGVLNTNPSLANFQRFTSWFFHSWKFSPVEKSTRETLNLPILSTSGQIYGRYRHCIAWRCNRKKNFVAKWWSKDLGKRKHYRWQANISCTTRWLHVDDEAVLTKLYVCWHVGGEK